MYIETDTQVYAHGTEQKSSCDVEEAAVYTGETVNLGFDPPVCARTAFIN